MRAPAFDIERSRSIRKWAREELVDRSNLALKSARIRSF